MRILMPALVVLLVATIGTSAVAEPLVVTGRGRAPIREGRRLDARAQALSSALHNALLKAVAKIQDVDSGDLTDDQIDEIEAALGPTVPDFVREKKITLDESDDAECRIGMQVEFDRDRLNASMLKANLTRRSSDHFWERIMIVVTEDHQFKQSSVQTALTRNFVEEGFRVVDESSIATIRRMDQASAMARGDVNAAAAIGRRFDAEIVIFGDALAQAIPQTNAGHAQRAVVNLQMIRTDNAQVLAANELVRSGIDQTPEFAARKAFAAASDAMGQYFLDQLDKRALIEKKKPRMIETVISGISYAAYVRLKQAMEEGIAGVSKFHARYVEPQHANVDVEFAGVAEDLADALVMHRFQEFRLTITRVTPSRVDLKVVERLTK